MNPNVPYVIETHALTKAYRQGEVVKSIHLQVPRHSIFGFLGPNGAGKSTTMRMLIGAIRPTRGTGKVFGLDIEKDSDRIRERIGFLTQDTQFYPDLTPRQTLRFCASFFPPMRGMQLEDRIQETLEFVGLSGKEDRKVQGFSGGEKQRLGMAQAYIHRPELLILDEPAAALDPMGRADVLKVMQQLRQHLISALAWFVVLILFALIFGANAGMSTSSGGNSQIIQDSAKGFFFQAWLFFPMLAAVFSTLGAISDERKQGTLPWVLSKPLPRSAFYLAKLLANLLAKSVTIILIPGLAAAVVLAVKGVPVSPVGVFGAMKLVGVVLFFYVALMLMMDALAMNRTIALLIPILFLFASSFLPQLALLFQMQELGNFLAQVTPMGITDDLLSHWITAGQAPDSFIPLICTGLWTIAFTVVGIVAFKRQEV